MLQLFPSYQTAEIPTWALSISARVSPVACKHRLRGALRAGDWVMRALYLLSFLGHRGLRSLAPGSTTGSATMAAWVDTAAASVLRLFKKI